MPVSDSHPDLGQDFANRFGELLKVAGANAKPKEPALVSATVERGLLVPVIRNAHKLSIAELARQAKELAAQAIQGMTLLSR